MGVPRRKAQTPPQSPRQNPQASSPRPQIELDRSDDEVYSSTTAVVRSVMTMSKEITVNKQAEYLDLVKSVGTELRNQLASVDKVILTLPSESHNDIEMAHKVLSSDMNELITAMKQAHKYSRTTLSDEARKGMLKAAHALAMDAKHLLDAVDAGRIMLISVQQVT